MMGITITRKDLLHYARVRSHLLDEYGMSEFTGRVLRLIEAVYPDNYDAMVVDGKDGREKRVQGPSLENLILYDLGDDGIQGLYTVSYWDTDLNTRRLMTFTVENIEWLWRPEVEFVALLDELGGKTRLIREENKRKMIEREHQNDVNKLHKLAHSLGARVIMPKEKRE